MILINIFCVETGRAYDFRAEENVPVRQIIEDIVTMIALKEHVALDQTPGLYMLCTAVGGKVLEPSMTFAESQISSGTDLILV